MNRGGGDENSGNLLMSLIPIDCPKPALFLFKRDFDDNNPIDVTDYTIDHFAALIMQEQILKLNIMCLYEDSNLHNYMISSIEFGISQDEDSAAYFKILSVSENDITSIQVPYDNKVYYYYFEENM